MRPQAPRRTAPAEDPTLLLHRKLSKAVRLSRQVPLAPSPIRCTPTCTPPLPGLWLTTQLDPPSFRRSAGCS